MNWSNEINEECVNNKTLDLDFIILSFVAYIINWLWVRRDFYRYILEPTFQKLANNYFLNAGSYMLVYTYYAWF